jgi:hypothetical protein
MMAFFERWWKQEGGASLEEALTRGMAWDGVSCHQPLMSLCFQLHEVSSFLLHDSSASLPAKSSVAS